MKKILSFLAATLLFSQATFAYTPPPGTNGQFSYNKAGIWGATSIIPSENGGNVATITPPSAPVKGQGWLSSSIAKVQAPISPQERYPLGVAGQEQNVWVNNGTWYNVFTNAGGTISIMTAPTTADITAVSFFYGKVSGTTLTVSDPLNIPSPYNGRAIQAGMTLQEGTGAVIQPFGTAGTTGTGGIGTYSLSGSPGTIANNQTLTANYWSVPVPIIGGGVGGVPGNAAHSGLYREGTTLYDYFTAITTNGSYSIGNVYVATADQSTPTVWTAQSTQVLASQSAGHTGDGNNFVVKSGSTYYLFHDTLLSAANPVEQTSTNWQEVEATSSSPTGTFTVTISPLKSLSPTPNSGSGHVRPYLENGVWVAYYHLGTWDRFFPNDIFRATNTNIATDTWTITNNGAPVVRRKHQFEVDQVADAELVQSPGGLNYLFYTAGDNSSGTVFYIMAAPLFPTPYQYDGAKWQIADSGYDTNDWWNNNTILWNSSIKPCVDVPSEYLGAWTPTLVAGQASSCALISDGAQNNYVDFDFNGWAPGKYTLTLNYQTNSSGGVITPQMEDGAGSFNYGLTNGSLTSGPNMLSYSNTLTNSAWNALNATTTANTTVESDGTQTGTTITRTASGSRIVNFISNVVSGATYTASAEFKAGTVDGYIAFVQAGVNGYISCVLSTQVCTVSGTGATGSIKATANGFYRLTLTQPTVSSASLNVALGPQDNTGTTSGYPACATVGGTVIAGRAQLELNSSASAYIQNTSPTADTYSAATGNGTWSTTFYVIGTEQYRRKIRLLMSTKNGSSSGYGLSLSGISVQRLVNGKGFANPLNVSSGSVPVSFTATPTAGTNVTSCTCASATCTNLRGTLTIVGGTATTGTICSLAWTTTPSAYIFGAYQNGGAAAFDIGNSLATTTGVNITAGVSVAASTLTVNYSAQP